MAEIKVTCDLSELAIVINSINEKAVKKAVSTSISRTFIGIKSAAMKAIQSKNFYDKKRLPAAKAKAKYFREAKNFGANVELSDMYAAFRITETKIPLIAFPHRRVVTATSRVNKKPLYGVRVSVLGKNFQVKGKFIGNIGKSNEQIFGRTGEFKAGTRREKIAKAHAGISMSDLFKRTGTADQIQKEADARMQKEMSNNLSYYLSKL